MNLKIPVTQISCAQPKILLEIHKEIIEGNLHVPVLPAVASKVRDNAQNQSLSVADLVRLLKSDAALVAYLLKITSCSLYARTNKPKSLLEAVSRLGIKKTRDLVFVYCVKSLFRSQNPIINKLLKRQWEHSTYIAAISSVLASHCKGMDSERAMLGGLLQDIGSLPVIEKVAPYATDIQSALFWDSILARYSAIVGSSILESWCLEKDLIDVVRSREKWDSTRSENANVADIVMVARLHSYVGTPRMRHLPRINSIPSFSKLSLQDADELNPELSLRVLAESRKKIGEIQRSIM